MAYSPSNIFSMAVTSSLLAVLLLLTLRSTEAQVVGVCYGTQANNLPSPQEVVNLYKANNIRLMRIYAPDRSILQAVQGSGIQLLLGVPNTDIQALAQNPSFAMQWVQNNVVPYASSIRYISVGNEVHPQSDYEAQFVGPAMQNMLNALNSVNLGGGRIPVSTTIAMSVVKNSYPPSNGEFIYTGYMFPVVDFIARNGFPLLVNVYPYFTYVDNQRDIRLDYALFRSPGTVVTDWNNGLQYQNLFDAIVDSVYAALHKHGAYHTRVAVSETAWPGYGGVAATIENAGTYYRNLADHVWKGTPLKPGPLETYMFAMFDEYQKPGAEVERHFGIFNLNQQSKYGQINFG